MYYELTAFKPIKQYRYTFRFNEFQDYDFRYQCHVKQFTKNTIDSAEEGAFSIFK